MATIKFTASIIRKDKGSYVAHADELSIRAEPATTQRGAIKKLRDTVREHLRKADNEGKLAELLNDAGYTGKLSGFPDMTLECHILDTRTVLVRLSPKRKRPRGGRQR